jgi:hypothetical protein
MALPIITAVRARHDLKESVFHTLIELAHRASIYGVVRECSLRYLAQKCHCCKQTIINHLNKLIELKIISKTVIWIKGNLCEINTYRFLIPWRQPPAQMCHSQKVRPNLPPQEREKNASVSEELENQRKALRQGWVSPGSERWEAVNEKIAYLEGLLAATGTVS